MGLQCVARRNVSAIVFSQIGASVIKGVHATCRHWARQIQSHGFKNSKYGRAGSGCYFWLYHSDPVFAEYLGFTWWKSQYDRGCYNTISTSSAKHENAKQCSLLVCEIKANGEKEVLDLSAGELKENLRELLRAKLKQLKEEPSLIGTNRDQTISELMDVFVRKMEEVAQTQYKAVIADVAVPKGAGGSIGAYMGASAEAVIAKDVSCIAVKEMKEMSAYDYV